MYIHNWFMYVSIKWDKNFKQQVLAVEKEMMEDAKKIIGFALVTFHSFAVAGSPKATGRYKGSHVFEVGSRGNFVNSEGKSVSQYEADAKKENERINNYRFDIKTGTYYIANNLEYASILEAGRSEQAKTGIYGPSSIKLESALRKKFAEYNAKRYK